MKEKRYIRYILWVIMPVVIIYTLAFRAFVPKPIPELVFPLAGQEIPKIEARIEIKNADVPKQANLYRFEIRHEDRYSEFDRAAKVFGLDARSNYTEVIDDARFRRIIYENDTGFWHYGVYGNTGFPQSKVPGNAEAEKIATRFLEENGFRDSRFSEIEFGRNIIGTNPEDEITYSVTVFYYPVIDGCEVLGVSRIAVEVDENGEICSVRSFYKDNVFDRVVDLIPPEQFYDKLFDDSTLCDVNPNAVYAKIVSIELAYWEDAGTIKEQPYLQPVWVFNGVSYDADGEESQFRSIVSAIKH